MDDTSPKNPPDTKLRLFKNKHEDTHILKTAVGVLIVILFALFHCILFPTDKPTSINIPQIDQIAQSDIIAPFAYDILKSDKQLAEERKIARENVPELLIYDDSIYFYQKEKFVQKKEVTISILDSLDDEKAVTDTLNIVWDEPSPETISTLRMTRNLDNLFDGIEKELDSLYNMSFVSSEWKNSKKNTKLFSINQDGKEKVVTPNHLITNEDIIIHARTFLGNKFKEYAPLSNASFDLLKIFITPNLIPDEETTQKRREEAVANISLTKGEVLKDEKIVGIHERVTEEIYEKLVSLEKAYENMQKKQYPFLTTLLPFFRFILMLVITILLFVYISTFQKEIIKNIKYLFLILALIIIQTASTFFLHKFNLPLELIPISITTIVVAILFSMELTISLLLVIALLVGFISSFDLALVSYTIVAGFFSAFLFRKITSRRELYKPILIYIVLLAVFIIASELIIFKPVNDILKLAGILALKSLFFPLVTIMFLPLFESLTGITSNITLSDFANTNLPILQQLSVEAPGTYQHSVIVSNLSEVAATAIKANSLVAKLGGLYHDIGKIINPGYFNENLKKDENPHYKLAPTMSFLIIKSHVKEGVDLARSLKIPKVIVDIIQQHHGTSVVESFYKKALKKDDKIKEADFRYPGPKPRTKEALIVVLADSVEAAVREISEPTEDKINHLVTNIVNKKLDDGEMDECSITLRELNKIKEVFVPILLGVHHKRIR
ncbi:HDIG domain-containing protein [bacterium]|nr:HDIG domain-containing protein [bacterium]